jgi:hypothetical protein
LGRGAQAVLVLEICHVVSSIADGHVAALSYFQIRAPRRFNRSWHRTRRRIRAYSPDRKGADQRRRTVHYTGRKLLKRPAAATSTRLVERTSRIATRDGDCPFLSSPRAWSARFLERPDPAVRRRFVSLQNRSYREMYFRLREGKTVGVLRNHLGNQPEENFVNSFQAMELQDSRHGTWVANLCYQSSGCRYVSSGWCGSQF